MRPNDRVLLAAGVAAAIALGISAHASRSGAYAAPASAQPGSVRVGTVDPYTIAQELLQQPEFGSPIDEAGKEWQQRLNLVDAEIRQLEQKVQVLSKTDPVYQEVMNEGRQKLQARQQLAQEAAGAIEGVKARQLAVAYRRAVEAANAVGERLGYTHIFASRLASKELTSNNVSTALQDMFARPLVRSPEADDLTKAVFDELRLAMPDDSGAKPNPTPEPPK